MQLTKKFKINLLVLYVLLSQSNLFAQSEDDKSSSVGTAVAVAAGSVAAGFGLYKLFDTFCSSSDRLVDDACKELIIAKQYKKQLEILEEEYEGLSNIERKQEIYEINEELAHKLSSNSVNKVIDYDFSKKLSSSIKNLKFYQTKLPKRTRKLQRERNKEKYTDIIKDMTELTDKINELVPKLEILNKYIETHKQYFELEEVYELVSTKFSKELKLLSSTEKSLVSKLKNCARAKFSATTSYPCIEYVKLLDSQIDKINKFISKSNNKYSDLISDAKELKDDLREIRKYIINDREYCAEQRDLEQVRAQENLASSMFWLGTAVGLATSPTVVKPKDEVVIIEEESCDGDVEIVTHDDVQVEVIEEV